MRRTDPSQRCRCPNVLSFFQVPFDLRKAYIYMGSRAPRCLGRSGCRSHPHASDVPLRSSSFPLFVGSLLRLCVGMRPTERRSCLLYICKACGRCVRKHTEEPSGAKSGKQSEKITRGNVTFLSVSYIVLCVLHILQSRIVFFLQEVV